MGNSVITREARGSNGSRNNRIRNGMELGASIQVRIDFSDNSHFLGSLLTSSVPAAWASTWLAILLEAELLFKAELEFKTELALKPAPEKDVADIACALDSLSNKLSIPLFWVKQNKVKMVNTITPHKLPVCLVDNLEIWISLRLILW